MSKSKTTERVDPNHTLSIDFITPIAARGYIHDSDKKRAVSQILNIMSEKEKRVLTLKSIGFTYDEIAEEIHVTPKTAESIMTKLRMRIIASFPNIAAIYGTEVCYG